MADDSQTTEADSLEVAVLKFKLEQLQQKRERIEAQPDASGFDRNASLTRNQAAIDEVEAELQRLQK